MNDESKGIKLMRVYLRDLSFESPAAPDVFKIKSEPEVELGLRIAAREVGGHLYEVVVTGTVTARAEGHTLYLCEAQQAGLFQVQGLEDEQLDRRLNVNGPKQIFPFLRETLASLTLKGGFPPLLISPPRFDELYAANQQRTVGRA